MTAARRAIADQPADPRAARPRVQRDRSTGGSGGARCSSTFLSPILFLAAMGLGLGDLRRPERQGRARGFSYAAFLAPGLLAGPLRCRRPAFESPARSLGSSSGSGRSTRCCATPIRSAGIVFGQLGWMAVPAGPRLGAFLFVIGRVRASAPRRSVVLAFPVGGPDRARVRDAARRVLGDARDAEQSFSTLVPLRRHAAVPVLRHVLPDRAAAAAAPARSPDHAALSRRRARPRALPRDAWTRWRAAGPCLVPGDAGAWRGLVACLLIFRAAAGPMTAARPRADRPAAASDRRRALPAHRAQRPRLPAHAGSSSSSGFFEPLFYLLGDRLRRRRARRVGRRARTASPIPYARRSSRRRCSRPRR